MVPESEWTKRQRDFVGTQFSTPKGGVLTVVGVSEEKSGSSNKFICECSICSKDEGLWPYGSIQTIKGNLTQGAIPCGCNKSPKWTKTQYELRAKRKSSELGWSFKGWAEEFKGNKTKIILLNDDTGNEWSTSYLNDLFADKAADPYESKGKRSKSKTIPDEIHIKEFIQKCGFSKGYTFWKSPRLSREGSSIYWYYTCPVCSNDEFVKEGICDGIFEQIGKHLKRGVKSCRCSDTYRWSENQTMYKINKVCKEEGLIFIGWENENNYVNLRLEFKWLCPKGHENTTWVKDFLGKHNSRCRTCSYVDNSEFGYYPNRVDEKDYLYIINFNSRYIKIGRSFNINERFRGSKGLLKLSKISRENIKILQVFTSNHQTVYDTEQWLHEELTDRGFYYNKKDGLWSIELFEVDCLQALNYLLKDVDLTDVSDEFRD